MKFKHFVEQVKIGNIEKIFIYKNPDDLNYWFPMIKTIDLNLHVLIDDQERPITDASIDGLLKTLKIAGAKKVEVIL